MVPSPRAARRCGWFRGISLAAALAVPLRPAAAVPPETGLLFSVSADHGTTADFSAAGTPAPTFDRAVKIIADGARGPALQCGDVQLLAWSAPGNIYAQRGTLSFFWRSRYAVGPTAFPLFRVGYGDHSSWDMVWLRIDYNGRGFDAFVTDASLARTRVSVTMEPFPAPAQWTHLALAWDETRGIRFYVNGRLAAQNQAPARYDAALDQFGPHSRIISPYNVQSDYNFVRGGDIDEIRIYDRMVDDADVATLARGDTPADLSALPPRDLAEPRWRDEWWLRYGWNRADDPPPYYSGPALAVRKVEIHDAYDLKRWWWKACDGIRETTWPGVYNRSRLPGRNDYFQLPDWDCYVQSGKSITFVMPDEPWNHLEISGAAWGRMELLPAGTAAESASDAPAERLLFERPGGQEKTVHVLPTPITGRMIRFTNAQPEEPIGELAAYQVAGEREPAGSHRLAYRLGFGSAAEPGVKSLGLFIWGRFPADERQVLIARPDGTSLAVSSHLIPAGQHLPIVHVLIPDTWDQLTDGLDGIAIDLPALAVKPTHGAYVPLNVQVKDPLWPERNMCDFTCSVKPGETKTLWLDLRDRLLPAGRPLYLTVACASSQFHADSLFDASVRLIFKPREAARPEHELDRFTQARDSYAMLVEEHPHSAKFNLWNRFEGDLKDLLRINPGHLPGRNYAAAALGWPRPPHPEAGPPPGVPPWAFQQVELLGRVKRFVNWYIDHRQVAYGDFGGGISDDVDLLNLWPGVALMGCETEKLRRSLHALLEAAFTNGMFTNGLPTIQTDELHSYEEGIDCLSANLILDYGNPRQIERAMATERGVEGITAVNAAGHRHIRTSYYSGTKMATEDPWGWAKAYSYLVLQPGQLLVDYNGSPAAKKVLLELADGLLAHRGLGADGRPHLPSAIHFVDDREGDATRGFLPWHVFWGAWRWTGDRRYLDPLLDEGTSGLMAVNANALDWLGLRAEFGPRILAGERGGPLETRPEDGRGRAPAHAYRYSADGHFVWQLAGDKRQLEQLYASEIAECDLLDYINTEGSLWIDRVGVPTADLQRARLGGVALLRNALYPGHVVSWQFAAPANDQSVAILIPDATPTAFKVIACNLETAPVRAIMTGWNIEPGRWTITQGVDTDDDDTADQALATRTTEFERTRSLEFTLPPRATSVLTLRLTSPGTPYWQRPDLAIGPDDVVREGGAVRMTVHNLGSVPARAATAVARDSRGQPVARATVPALEAPVDLRPRTVVVTLPLPAGADSGGSVEIIPDPALPEITALNNTVGW